MAFSSDAALVGGDVSRGAVRYCGAGDVDVVLYNEGRVVGKVSSKSALAFRALQSAKSDRRPGTAVQAADAVGFGASSPGSGRPPGR